jgi:hypothetical protein
MRHFFQAVAQVDVKEALHESWRHQSPEMHLASGTAGFAAWWAGINWGAVAAALTFIIPLAWGLLMQCWKQTRVTQIAIREAQIASDDRIAARRAGERSTPVSTIAGRILVPDARPSA